MSSLQEVLLLADEVRKELGFYDAGPYKANAEQTALNRCKDHLANLRNLLTVNEQDGTYRPSRLTTNDWKRLADLVAPLARCFTSAAPARGAGPTVKGRFASAAALSELALLSTTSTKAKVILTTAVESGVVGAIVRTLRDSVRSPIPDRGQGTVKAMLYKLAEALLNFSVYATFQQRQTLVRQDVVDVSLELFTSTASEQETKVLASKTIYVFLATTNRVVTELRTSKVTALNDTLQLLLKQVPDAVAAATSALAAAGSGTKSLSMPGLLPYIMDWVWLLPDYILHHLISKLVLAVDRLVVLVWPEGHPGIPVRAALPGGPNNTAAPDMMEVDSTGAAAEAGGSGGAAAPEALAGPLQVAQHSLTSRTLRQALENLLHAVQSDQADPRLLRLLRGSRLPDQANVVHSPDQLPPGPPGSTAAQGPGVGYFMALPARLVRVVQEGRADGMEVRVALELLDKMFPGEEEGAGGQQQQQQRQLQLGDDALAAGLLRAMSELPVFTALEREPGLSGLTAYISLALKLVKRAATDPDLASRLRASGVPASVAYIAFMPGSKWGLKQEALKALSAMFRLDTPMAAHLVAMTNFPTALANTLLGGDPDTRKQAKKSGSKKKGGAAAASTDPGSAAAQSSGGPVVEAMTQGTRNARDQIQETAFNILLDVLEVAKDGEEEWRTVVESGLLPRLLQHAPAFPMRPGMLAEILAAVGLAFVAHAADVVGVGALQAACAPHLLPLLPHEDPVVAVAAARVLQAILEDMTRYRATPTDLEQGDDILKALVAAGAAAIDTTDAVVAARAAAVAKAAAAANGGEDGAAGSGQSGNGAGQAAERTPSGAIGGDGSGQGTGAATEAAARGADASAGAGAPPPAPSTAQHQLPLPPLPAATQHGAAASGEAGPTSGSSTTVTAMASAAAAPARELPDLVDVTAHGLGLVCTALQGLVDKVLQRPQRQGQGEAPPPGPLGAPPQAAAPANTNGTGAGVPAPSVDTAPAAAAGSQLLPPDCPAYEALEVLLNCTLYLAKASLDLPRHAAIRRHLARAFAYARPPVEELAAALQALLPAVRQQHEPLEAEAARVLGALAGIPVLDVALLPKPSPEEEVEAGEAAAPAGGNASRRGRPTGSKSKRTSAPARAATDPPPAKKPRRAAQNGAAAGGAGGPTSPLAVQLPADGAAAPPSGATAELSPAAQESPQGLPTSGETLLPRRSVRTPPPVLRGARTDPRAAGARAAASDTAAAAEPGADVGAGAGVGAPTGMDVDAAPEVEPAASDSPSVISLDTPERRPPTANQATSQPHRQSRQPQLQNGGANQGGPSGSSVGARPGPSAGAAAANGVLAAAADGGPDTAAGARESNLAAPAVLGGGFKLLQGFKESRAKMQAELDAKQRELEEAEAAKHRISAALDSRTKENATLLAELAEKAMEVEALTAQLAAAEAGVKEKTQQAEMLTAQVLALEAGKKELTTDLEHAQQKAEAARAALAAERARAEAAEQRAAAVERDFAQYKEAMENGLAELQL